MIFYGLVSGLALVLETGWKAARVVGIDIPLPEALQDNQPIELEKSKM